MSKVFVSYKRVDKDKVFPIVHKMESKLGIKFWVDLDGIESDEQFTNVIIKAINECEVFLFMYSKTHERIADTTRDWTVREINFADLKRKRIVFVDLDDVKLPDWFLFTFPHKQVTRANDNRAMGKLADDIRKWLRLPQPNPSPNEQSQAADTKDIQARGVNQQLKTSNINKLPDIRKWLRLAQSKFAEASHPHPQAIDLGLPSGTKWASYNVGATKPEEYGDYYAWGETHTKGIYKWDTYKHCDGDSDSCHNLGHDISGTEHDLAHVKWGGNWRMPSVEDFTELLENCTTVRSVLNGVEGCKLTSKINGNSIFLPAASYRWHDNLDNASSGGYYWSSTQNPSYPSRAYGLYFGSGFADWSYDSGRYRGFTVRPVSRI